MPAPGQPPIPPQLSPPPGGTGGVTTPQPQMGQGASAMSDVRNALMMLQKALPGLPMGSELHNDVLKAVTNISKHMDATDKGPNKGIDIQSMIQQAKGMNQASPQAALIKAMGAGGAPPAGGGAPAPAM